MLIVYDVKDDTIQLSLQFMLQRINMCKREKHEFVLLLLEEQCL